MELCYARRAAHLEHRYLDSASASARILLKCQLPLSEIVSDFYSLLKGRSSGYASFECVIFPGPIFFRHGRISRLVYSYEDAGYRKSNLSKVRRSGLMFVFRAL